MFYFKGLSWTNRLFDIPVVWQQDTADTNTDREKKRGGDLRLDLLCIQNVSPLRLRACFRSPAVVYQLLTALRLPSSHSMSSPAP